MGATSPVAVLLVVIIAVAFTVALAAFIRDHTRFRGYQEVSANAFHLADLTAGEVFREGRELVVAGNCRGLPVTVRFSHEETAPALYIRMGAPTTFSLAVTPIQARVESRFLPVRTRDDIFNTRFACRSDQPTHAKLFLSRRRAVDVLRQICSSQTWLSVENGTVEFSQMGVVDAQTGHKAEETVPLLADFVAELRTMPGADTVAVASMRVKRRAGFRHALAIGILATVAAIAFLARERSVPMPPAAADAIPPGIWPVDARKIPSISGWYLATGTDFDPSLMAWARGQGLNVRSRIPADFTGVGSESDVAYVLTNEAGEKRLVILSRGANRFDSRYSYIGLVARVPKNTVDSIQWLTQPTPQPEGDGVLLVRKPNDPASGLILFLNGARITSGVPQNYQNLKLE